MRGADSAVTRWTLQMRKSDEGRQTLGHKPGSASPYMKLGREPGVDIFGLTYTTLLRPTIPFEGLEGLHSQVLAVVRALAALKRHTYQCIDCRTIWMAAWAATA